VAHEQHGLGCLAEPILEPPLARDIEIVVGLVEQEHFVRPAQQGLDREPLLLTAGQGCYLAVLAPVERHSQRRDHDGVPQHLGLVASDIAPVREGVRVVQLAPFIVVVHESQLGGLHGRPGLAHRRRRQSHEEFPHGGGVPHGADELPHHAKAARAGHAPRLRAQVTGDEPQEGRLAGAICPDQGSLAALADPEVHVVEQHSAIRQHIPCADDLDVPHGEECPVAAPAGHRISGDNRRYDGHRDRDVRT
jgi:hypothetical protein